MSRTSTLIVLGVLTMLVPFSGLPVGLRTWLTIIFGALVTAIALFIRSREAAETKVVPVPVSESVQEAPAL